MVDILRDIKRFDTAHDNTRLEKLPFDLQKNEKIIRELKPQFLGFIISMQFNSYIAILIFVLLAIPTLILINYAAIGFLVGIIAVPVLILLVSIGPLISYGKSWYWITNHRVIGKRGFLSYDIHSIPLDNVTDIVLSRTLLDRVLGLSSLIIVPMGGNSQMSNGTFDEKSQNTNFFPALTEKMARELQRVLFNLRDELNEDHASKGDENSKKDNSSEKAQPKSDFPRGT